MGLAKEDWQKDHGGERRESDEPDRSTVPGASQSGRSIETRIGRSAGLPDAS
jgi:hypothetical protein